INNDGHQYINSGGRTTDTTINKMGYQSIYDGGNASNTTINFQGDQYIYNGGSSSNTTINERGDQYIYSGGSAINIIINDGGEQFNEGSATDTTINSGGMAYIYSGGNAINTIINDNGKQYIYSGGSATDITINSGGFLFVSGGSATNTFINTGGTLQVTDNGRLLGNEVTNNGHIYFINNSSANYTGSLTGTGNLKVEGGNLTLSGTLSQDGGASIVSNGTMIMDNLQATADVMMQSGTTLNLQNASNLTGAVKGEGAGAGNVNMNNATWNMTGDSTVDTLKMDNGTIDFHPSQTPFKPATLTAGSLSGKGTFIMNTDIAAHTGDLLNVTGNASGSYMLNIRNTGQEPASAGAPLRVVHTGSGDARFALNGGKVDAGTWEYYLNKENTDWYLKADD
ncbi:AIDA repeat-containing protein, partial [Escherichia coli]|nr:AIDA repeat-containing protein [Escherichia coli]EID2809907.1 AIDA repeat-containing protein [Escherichia coli]EJE3054205.1 AIDA repeat-containing protein [Escherichia coli]